MTAIEELVNSRAPEIAIYFRTYLCANSLRERVRCWSSRKKTHIAATRLAWTAVILNSSETSGPVGHLKCTIAVYIKSFGGQKGGSSEPLEPPQGPAYGPEIGDVTHNAIPNTC